jgi:hypothetical protein
MNKKFDYKITIFLVSLLYLLLVGLLEGLKVEHWAIVGFYNLCLWANPKSRKFILAFTVFVIFGIIYDLMKVYPNYKVNSVDVASIYHFEKGLFGFMSNGVKVTPNEFFALHHTPLLDLMSGLFYVNWMPVPLAFGIWLLFKDKGLFLRFSIAFLFVNLIGFCIYYIHPAAPPWYVAKYGFDLHLGTGGETAGLARFDEMVHAKIFGSIYSRNSNVFAAMPSLHCSYPVVVLFYAIKSNMKWMRYFFVIFMLGIWFSAIYSGHHYVSDAIAGISCAIAGLLIFEKVLMKRPGFKRFIDRYTNIIS